MEAAGYTFAKKAVNFLFLSGDLAVEVIIAAYITIGFGLLQMLHVYF